MDELKTPLSFHKVHKGSSTSNLCLSSPLNEERRLEKEKYSNEITLAREGLTNSKSNSISSSITKANSMVPIQSMFQENVHQLVDGWWLVAWGWPDQPWWIEVVTTAEIQIHAEKERRQEIFGWISSFIINPLVNISMALSVRRRAAKSMNPRKHDTRDRCDSIGGFTSQVVGSK